jgi:hypothetical protein
MNQFHELLPEFKKWCIWEYNLKDQNLYWVSVYMSTMHMHTCKYVCTYICVYHIYACILTINLVFTLSCEQNGKKMFTSHHSSEMLRLVLWMGRRKEKGRCENSVSQSEVLKYLCQNHLILDLTQSQLIKHLWCEASSCKTSFPGRFSVSWSVRTVVLESTSILCDVSKKNYSFILYFLLYLWYHLWWHWSDMAI